MVQITSVCDVFPDVMIHSWLFQENIAGLAITQTYKPSISHKLFPTLDTRPLTSVVQSISLGVLRNIECARLGNGPPGSRRGPRFLECQYR